MSDFHRQRKLAYDLCNLSLTIHTNLTGVQVLNKLACRRNKHGRVHFVKWNGVVAFLRAGIDHTSVIRHACDDPIVSSRVADLSADRPVDRCASSTQQLYVTNAPTETDFLSRNTTHRTTRHRLLAWVPLPKRCIGRPPPASPGSAVLCLARPTARELLQSRLPLALATISINAYTIACNRKGAGKCVYLQRRYRLPATGRLSAMHTST